MNREGEKLGRVEGLMIDLEWGRVAYAVLCFGGFLGIGNKLFAIPFEALELDAESHLEKPPGFDKNYWPDFADARFGVPTYWA